MARFILSRKKVLQEYNSIKKHADTVSYSYKTNKEVGKILLEETDSFFSVHSIESVEQLNSPERIWFFAQGWNKTLITRLIERKITRFVVDNDNDLNVLVEYLKRYNVKISLLLRMRLKEHTVHTGKHFVFGMYSKKINELVPILKENKSIKKLGIHFHRKTQNVSEWDLLEELKNSIDDWDKIDIVNVGGGIPAEYKNFRPEAFRSIFAGIDELKEWLNNKGIEMIIEPGRAIAAKPIKLEAEIINLYDSTIVVDCSIFNSCLDTWISNIRLLVEGESDSGKAYTIKGITPDSADILRYKVHLEQEPKTGDRIVFTNAGAYNFHTDFCNLKKLETVVVD
ncbi:MAG: decarboxylase [Nanoarchaeota archaeon]|nr:decarboxylase [Nanoarchaeota archaeon]